MTQQPTVQDKVLRYLRYEVLQQMRRVLLSIFQERNIIKKKTFKIVRHQVFQLFTWTVQTNFFSFPISEKT